MNSLICYQKHIEKNNESFFRASFKHSNTELYLQYGIYRQIKYNYEQSELNKT